MRTVLTVDPLLSTIPGNEQEMVAIRVDRTSFRVTEGLGVKLVPLPQAKFPAWGTPDVVRERGRRLREALQSHPGVERVLTHLAELAEGEVEPLFVRLGEGSAELINWEALTDADGGFVALNEGSPIGRISDPPSIQARPPAVLKPPVRMLAVISAFGIASQPQEWELCRKAVENARADRLPVQLRVLVGDKKLRATIDQEITDGLADVEVGSIEKTGSRLVQEIIAWEPNIVHFFCHGTAEDGVQALELASASDFADRSATGGSVRVTAKQLSGVATALSNPWLLTLNCCSSGTAAKDLHSMAHKVVAAGFPAAVAMVEPVDAEDAHEFTRVFYRDVFRRLSRVRPALQEAKRVHFEWVNAMVSARNAISDLHADGASNSHQWLLPVLYVRGIEPLQFESDQGVPDDLVTEYRLRAGIVAEWLQTVPDMDVERRRAVMAKLLKGVPERYWPDVEGTFGDA